MKKINLSRIYLFLFLMLLFTGCELVGDIFEAGVWVGVFIVVVIILFALWLLAKIMR